jgi:membrane fusion protein, copper/silver efflux system
MTDRFRYLISGVAIGALVAAILAVGFLWSRSPTAADGIDPAAHTGHGDHADHPQPAPRPGVREADAHAEHAAPAPATDQEMQLSPRRLQSIGVRFEPVGRRALDRQIRTTGHVEIDERRLARVTLKVQGWVEQLHVNATGEQVRQGQPLLTLYSPDLLVTQEEHLLALESARTIGESAVPEVAGRADALVEATRRRLRLWDISDAQVRELERTREAQRTLTIPAPIGGTVINRAVFQGAQVMPGEELYTIADLSRVWVLADIYEHDLPFVRVGQEADITLAYEPGVNRRGRMTFIYPTVTPETRTARVRFEVPNPEGQLKPGMFVHVDLAVPVGTRLAVPRDAVMDTGMRQLVFLHLGEGRIAWRDIRTGARVGEWIEVLAGLDEGEHIVTSPAFLIDSESRLGAAVAGLHAGH